MTNLPIQSISNNGKSVRTAGTVEEPLFSAKDIVECVSAKWNRLRSIQHVPSEWRVKVQFGGESDSPLSETQWFLTELGLYFYLNRSDKPAALPWQKKVAETLGMKLRSNRRRNLSRKFLKTGSRPAILEETWFALD